MGTPLHFWHFNSGFFFFFKKNLFVREQEYGFCLYKSYMHGSVLLVWLTGTMGVI